MLNPQESFTQAQEDARRAHALYGQDAGSVGRELRGPVELELSVEEHPQGEHPFVNAVLSPICCRSSDEAGQSSTQMSLDDDDQTPREDAPCPEQKAADTLQLSSQEIEEVITELASAEKSALTIEAMKAVDGVQWQTKPSAWGADEENSGGDGSCQQRYGKSRISDLAPESSASAKKRLQLEATTSGHDDTVTARPAVLDVPSPASVGGPMRERSPLRTQNLNVEQVAGSHGRVVKAETYGVRTSPPASTSTTDTGDDFCTLCWQRIPNGMPLSAHRCIGADPSSRILRP